MTPLAASDLRLHLTTVDVALLVVYVGFVLAIGLVTRRTVGTSLDFLLAGRTVPLWITSGGFISANVGAMALLAQSASGAQYGAATLHYFWVGAVPAMVFLGVVMMPYYYRSGVRSLPEFLLRRYDRRTHLAHALTFVVASVFLSGANLFALSVVLEALLGVPTGVAILLSAAFVLAYVLLGGLLSVVYTEVLQFCVVVFALVPLTVVVLREVGGLHGLVAQLRVTSGAEFVDPWAGTGIGGANPLSDWVGIVLGLGFCLSFGYWTTNFTEVQRALVAQDLRAARLTPVVAALPKLLIPFITVVPGMAAVLLLPGLGEEDGLAYNQVVPGLMAAYLPPGVLGLAVTGLVAAFMAGMAANVSAFNTVFTYDVWQGYVRPGRPDGHYLSVGRWATVVAVVPAVGAAFLASRSSNLASYLQVLFSFVNVPIFCVFLLGMLSRRLSRDAGAWGIGTGTAAAVVVHLGYRLDWGPVFAFRSDLHQAMWGSVAAFAVAGLSMVAVSLRSARPLEAELHGLVLRRRSERHAAAAVGAGPDPRLVLASGAAVVACVGLYAAVAAL